MKVARKRAIEQLTADASVSDFIAEIAKNSAEFIKTNRAAFHADNDEAVKEFVNVFTVAEVAESIAEFLAQEEESEETVEDSEATAEDTTSETTDTETESTDSGSEENGDLVSADVMALLDE